MNNKRNILVFSMTGMLVILVIYYIFFLSSPKTFLSNEQLVEALNESFPETRATEIQDTIFLDDRHVVVPFISNQNEYGLSFWAWKMKKWQILSIHTRGQPHIWKLDPKDPTSYYFVWNIHPNDYVKNMSLFLIRDRNFLVSDEVENYYPKIQMEEEISFSDATYGVLPFPANWSAFMNDLVKVESPNQPYSFFPSFFPMNQLHFGWMTYDHSNNQVFAELSSNGSRYSNGKINLDWVMIINESDLE